MGASIWTGVRERVKSLARTDRARKVFGAWDSYGAQGHPFRLADPLSESDVSAAEAQWGISLPDDYRSFMLDVGAGGAGPGYGLSTLSRSAAGWLWTEVNDAMPHDRMRLPFPPPQDSARLQAEHSAGEPEESAFTDEDSFRDAVRAWLARDDTLFEWSTSGALNLCHEGCGYCYWLVLSGPERGHIWLDERPGDGTFQPLGTPATPVDFTNWYLDWLNKSETTARHESR
ncbi:SMI1/KNR4 family protein [Streptomyces sp. NPDC088747]|uniref:SMI1/KNR4 family protein n=1 Tax=Streptomyces sp. NPDC088747 TaxID=3365886 RepID=UPI0038205D83